MSTDQLLKMPSVETLAWPLGGTLRRVQTPSNVQRLDIAGHAAYLGRGLVFMVTLDRTQQHGTLLHVSLSHRHRDPYWDEIKAARKLFFPDDVDVMMMLPRESDYVNLHEHCFHLIQTPEKWGIQ